MIQDKLDLARATGKPTAFYPPIEPYNTGRLRVSDLHEPPLRLSPELFYILIYD